ncbi:MAG: prepilin-type N-terminal cleavage/methylation domain-containing protein [Planctomycetota bacterium]|jgi:Tfp pilus assembly protein PilV
MGKRSNSNPHRSRGFTFLELLVASGVLAVIAIGSAATLVQGPRITRAAEEEVSVRAAIRGMVSELTAAPFDTFAAKYNNKGFEVLGVDPVEGDSDGLPGQILISREGEGAATFYEIQLSVTWDGIHGIRTLSSTHYLANVRGDTGTPSDPEGES